MKNVKLMTVVVILQGVIIAGQWLGTPAVVAPAQAQIPDAGGQRLEIISEIRGVNAKLEKMIGILESGKLEVRVAPSDENKGRR